MLFEMMRLFTFFGNSFRNVSSTKKVSRFVSMRVCCSNCDYQAQRTGIALDSLARLHFKPAQSLNLCKLVDNLRNHPLRCGRKKYHVWDYCQSVLFPFAYYIIQNDIDKGEAPEQRASYSKGNILRNVFNVIR